jgi:adenosylmethionine-8-amino-7-oxononanoate aminotransferase
MAGTRSSEPGWFESGFPHIWLPYTQMRTAPRPEAAVATQGVRIKLADGRELLDGIASWWTACHGYNHPRITAAIARQLEQMPHVMFAGLVHEPALALAKRLADLAPGELARVFFCDSGSVAVEVALKMAVQYWSNLGHEGRTRFVGFRHGYHGDTLAAMAVGDVEFGLHRAFAGYVPEHITVDLPAARSAREDFSSMLARHRNEVAALIIEPLVQGAGGMRFHSAETLAFVFAAAKSHGLLVIADEIFTGFGRTGSMFACEAAGIAPDILCLSKALTGGAIGLGATMATEEIFAAFLSDDPAKALMHGPTYMANPLACAAANASLDLFAFEPRLKQANAIGVALQDALAPLKELKGVKDVRALGAIGVVQLEAETGIDWLRQRFLAAGLLIRPFADVIYLTPAFVIEPADLAQLTSGVVAIAREWSRRFV